MKETRNNTKIIAILTLMVCGLTGCGYDQLPPKTTDTSSNYILPEGELPDEKEKEIVQMLRKEYEESIQP